ncbi:MAG: nitrogenase component 1 [Methanocorpusculum sp.]|nr:nitrogenase component 1 [Methanocorpusculum sp.]
MPSSRCAVAEEGLAYYLPEPERFHTILRIPGSHTLYVGPSSCMRRHAFHAEKYGGRNDISFLFISEEDVVSGGYESLIGNAIEELCSVLSPVPHIFSIAVFCIDDFLGTDEEALLDGLHTRFPEQKFVLEHIDPVTLGSGKFGGMKKKSNLYSFLEPGHRDSGVNFLGNFVPPQAGCELWGLLDAFGAFPVRQIFDCRTWDEYQAIANSRLSVVLRDMGQIAAEYLEEKLGIPFYVLIPGYDADAVVRGYSGLAAALGAAVPDFSREVAEVHADAARTCEILAGRPVALDSSAMLLPFSAAKALIGYGFNVTHIFCSHRTFEADEAAETFIRSACPSISVSYSSDYAADFPPADEGIIAIGSDCAQLLCTSRVVDIWHDEGYFGFHGIHRLFAALREAV